MVVYSTQKGYASIRYQEDGSPLLETLASTITEYSEKKELATTDMETLMNKIKQKISVNYGLLIEVSSSLAKEFLIPAKDKLGKTNPENDRLLELLRQCE